MTNESGSRADRHRPLVMHVIFRFSTGGTENGIVNLVNGLPPGRFRHAIVALSDVDAEFSRRLQPEVEMMALRKPPGHGYRCYAELYRLFRSARPAIVHSRNLAALEALLPAWLAGVPVRIHGEHGWDMSDPGGHRMALRWVRRMYRPFVGRYVAVSQGLLRYLVDGVGVEESRIDQIYNGVDTMRFSPRRQARFQIEGCPFDGDAQWLIGTVGRMQPVKDQITLVRAFIDAAKGESANAQRLRLVLVGEGPLRAVALSLLREAGLEDHAWLAGERTDVEAVMRGLDCFVLPSLAEGMSNTILEAMASGLPVIATNVGGNPELVVEGQTGHLVPPADVRALCRRMVALADSPSRAAAMGQAGRIRAESKFGLDVMVARYRELYETMLLQASGGEPAIGTAR